MLKCVIADGLVARSSHRVGRRMHVDGSGRSRRPLPKPLNVQVERQATKEHRELLEQARAKYGLATHSNVDLKRLRTSRIMASDSSK